MKMKRGIVAGSMVCLFWGSVMAANIAPRYQFVTLKPGEHAWGIYTLTNDENEKLNVTAEAKDWFVLPENNGIGATTWLTFKKPKFLLKKGKTKKVKFYVVAPEKAKGELVGMVSFLIEGEKVMDLNRRLSSAVYVGIEGTEELKGELSAFSIKLGTNSVSAGVVVENKGNVHLRPKGHFDISTSSGLPVAALSIDEGGVAYPGKNQSFFGTLNGVSLGEGEYVVKISLQDIDRQKEFVQVEKKFLINKEGQVELK